MRQILPYIDVVIANEEDCHDVLEYKPEKPMFTKVIDVEKYPDVARRLVDQFPSIQVAIIRESHSATHNNWGAMLFDSQYDRSYFAPLNANQIYQAYEIKDIVDRVGGGDSFAGGLIFALITPELSDPKIAVKYAVAASCLKHSLKEILIIQLGLKSRP